jgi:uncharacterized protein (DUF952 family)
MRILHLALADDWAAARERGVYAVSTRGVTLAEQGYVHGSTVAQVGGVAAAFYADAGPLVLLVLDVAALEAAGSPVRWEVPDGAGTAFPHAYGPVPLAAVVAELPVTLRDGRLELPDLAGLDVVSASDSAGPAPSSTGGASAGDPPPR